MDVAARAAELDRLHRNVRVRRTRSLLASWAWRFFAPPRAVTVEDLPAVTPGEVAISFGGHATALVRYADCGVVLDPMLGHWVGGVHRAVAPGLGPAELAAASVALVSHAHADHLHLPSLARLPAGATVVGPPGLAARLGPHRFARVIELADGAGVELDAIRVDATAVPHGADDLGPTLAFTVTGDGPRVFACGDGGYGEAFARVGEVAPPDVALLPIGGYWPRGFRARHLSPLDALYAFEDLRARVLVPIHHGAFALSYERLDEPARWLAALVAERGLDAHVRILAPGQSAVWRGARRVVRPSTATAAPSAAAVAAGPWQVPPVTLGSPPA
ncbi:MAG: MBL fold metallo-hydrolase [Kofleriaceae bacterium]